MRLTSEEIEYLARKIVKTLVAQELIEVDEEARVAENVAIVVGNELQIEDRLNEEVRDILSQHATQMERSDITYSDMFKKTKRELAKKKGVIL